MKVTNTIKDIIKAPASDVIDWAIPEFFEPLTNTFDSTDDMVQISKDIIKLVNQYSYLAATLAALKVECRVAKNTKPKAEYEDMVDKKEVIQKALDAVKLKHSALSRMVTIKQEINKEINMSKTL